MDMAEKNTSETTFESAMERLEQIVEQMESDKLPLEEMLERYEEGTKLAKTCQEKLAEAELKIQRLEKTESGEMKLKPVAMPGGEVE